MLKGFRISAKKIVETPAGDAPILVFISPDEAERKELVGRFHIDEHTLTSALDADESPRLEFEPDHGPPERRIGISPRHCRTNSL